jgi:hypothetical protein
MNLGQPTHDDGEEETEKSRNGCQQTKTEKTETTFAGKGHML